MPSPLADHVLARSFRPPSPPGLSDALRHPISRSAWATWLWIVLSAASIFGFLFAARALVMGIMLDGGLAYDARSYYEAGQAILNGTPLYADVPIDAAVAYRYPPFFALLFAPFALLPEQAFAWGWRIICLVSLRYICGSWRTMGIALCIPWPLVEVMSANVTFPLAAMTVAALRGRAYALPWAIALKWGPIVAVPYIWIVRPQWRRSLLIGVASVVALIGAHILIAPSLYGDYLHSMTHQASSALVSGTMLSILPTAGADFLLRVALTLVGVTLAIRLRSDRLAFAMTVLAQPTLWIQRLTALFGMAGLPPRPQKSRGGGA